jgi:hypothetical protein
MRRDFVVDVTHDGKPLKGVTVLITKYGGEEAGSKLFSATTASDGTVHVADLPAGVYWLDAELLGITAGSQCFHIGNRTSRKAKRKVTYEWGDLAPAIRQVAGRLIDSQPGQGGSPLWNQFHRVEGPISEARLRLQDALSDGVYSTLSNSEGHFSFSSIPNGIYVLHVEGGTAPGGRGIESSDHLIRLSGNAKGDTLLLSHRDAGFGSCGGTSLELEEIPK